METDLRALEDLAVRIADLEQLKVPPPEFNVFEAMGVVFQEVRHSDFLAFLLDPRGHHGLGDRFAKGWLKRLVGSVRGAGGSGDAGTHAVSPDMLKRLDRIDMSDARVYRERHRIDVLLVDQANRLAVIVENKIFSGEHNDQLTRYRQSVEERCPDFDLVYVFLTPTGEPPSHIGYVAADYGGICEEVESIVEEGVLQDGTHMDQEVCFALSHYARLLRRYIVTDSETADLARRLYLEHGRAFELVYATRYSHQKRLRGVLTSLVEGTPGLVYSGKVGNPPSEWIIFYPEEWDVPALRRVEDVRGRLIINFVFDNLLDRLSLKLQFRGDGEVRGQLLEMAREDPELFAASPIPNPQGLTTIWRMPLLTREDHLGGTYSDLERLMREGWDVFLGEIFPRISEAMRRQEWTRI